MVPVKFELLTLKVVSESRVTWATSVSLLVDLGPMYVTDRQINVRRPTDTDVRQHHRLMSPPIRGGA